MQPARGAARRLCDRAVDPVPQHPLPPAVDIAQVGVGRQVPQRDGGKSDHSRRRDAVAAQRHPARHGVGAAQESAGVDRGAVRSDAAGVRDARPAQRRLPPPRSPSARLLHPDEGGADPLARDQRHVRDAPHSHPDRDAVAAERIARPGLHRDPVQHLVEADAHRAHHPAAAGNLAPADAQEAEEGQPPPRQHARRDDERAAGDDQRHPPGEGLGHRELRGIAIRRRKQQVRAQQSQDDTVWRWWRRPLPRSLEL